jgi:hypothetical protein
MADRRVKTPIGDEKGTGVVLVPSGRYSSGFEGAECHVKSDSMKPDLSTT